MKKKVDKENIMRFLGKIFGIRAMCRIKSLLSVISSPISKIRIIVHICRISGKNEIKDVAKWKRLFIKTICSSNEQRIMDMIEHFYQDELKLVKESNAASEVIVVCTVKDDLVRIKKFLEYYRNLKVKKFLMIDNGSKDGTKEYLESCNDVTLYQCKCAFSSTAKAAWNNVAIAKEGINKWFLIVDSDELFAYPEMDRMDLNRYAIALRSKSINAVKAIMLEMYPKGKLLDETSNDDFWTSHCYFDGNANEYEYDPILGVYSGGFHERLFESGKTTRTKRPLVFYEGKRIAIGAHDIYPLYDNICAEMGAALLHYKFLPGDGKRIKKIIAEGNYANGSRLYKLYASKLQDENFSAYYEGSVKWNGSKSLFTLPFIRELTMYNGE